jgi:N12 class adenine-specific DNA methylase
MYTNDMRKAFHSIVAPKGFNVEIIDNDHFLTIKLDERKFVKMFHDEKIQALQYVVQVKKALEMNGAIVLVTREAVK